MLKRLLLEDYDDREALCKQLVEENMELKVPTVNDTTTLHNFNCELSTLFDRSQYWFNKSRQDKDAIERLLEVVLKDYYVGKNDAARRAAGYQFAQKYPIPEDILHFFNTQVVNLFELEDKINGCYYTLDAIMKSLHHKSSAKITNNSILNIERSLVPN